MNLEPTKKEPGWHLVNDTTEKIGCDQSTEAGSTEIFIPIRRANKVGIQTTSGGFCVDSTLNENDV